jgi:hypothetical protein
MGSAAELQAICELCLSPIGDGDGALWVDRAAPGSRAVSDEADTARKLWNGRGVRAVWRVTHDDCARPRTGYRIEVERIRTWAAYLHWTAHLMSKDWIGDTNWSEVVLDSLNPTSSTMGGIRPVVLRDPGHRNVGD